MMRFLTPTCRRLVVARQQRLPVKTMGSSSHWRHLASAGTQSTDIEQPTRQQLRIVALHAAIPMVGFGFMDNLVMIQVGEAIDMSLGVTFGLSTLTAAGLGQCVSDVAGNTCGGLVDAIVARLNMPHHNLTEDQLDLKSSRFMHTLGGSVGVVIGCLMGMSCLLFMDTARADRAKKAKELTSIFETIMHEGHHLVNAERATLWMVDPNTKTLWSLVATGTEEKIHISSRTGVVGACVQSGELINIRDAYLDRRFNRQVDKSTGFRTKSIIVIPILDDDGRIVGAIEMMNKKNADGSDGVFQENDEKLLTMLASHVTAFVRIVNGN